MTTDRETALAFYETARSEIITRIQMRETAIFVWLGAIGVVGGIAFSGEHPPQEVLLILPLLGVGFAMRISDHERIIGQLAVYTSKELAPFLSTEPQLLQWDSSVTLHDKSFQGKIVRVRGDVYYIFIVIPEALALALNAEFIERGGLLAWLVAAVDLLCIVLSAVFVATARKARVRSTKETKPQPQDSLFGGGGSVG